MLLSLDIGRSVQQLPAFYFYFFYSETRSSRARNLPVHEHIFSQKLRRFLLTIGAAAPSPAPAANASPVESALKIREAEKIPHSQRQYLYVAEAAAAILLPLSPFSVRARRSALALATRIPFRSQKILSMLVIYSLFVFRNVSHLFSFLFGGWG